MNWHQAFQVANTYALLMWLLLIALPRWRLLITVLRYYAIGVLCVVYATVVVTQFGNSNEGGFGSLEDVKKLFSYDAAVFAGWVHYLIFDLFVGIWIAERMDETRVHRLVQVPVLGLTFIFGPVGLLAYYIIASVQQIGRRTSEEE